MMVIDTQQKHLDLVYKRNLLNKYPQLIQIQMVYLKQFLTTEVLEFQIYMLENLNSTYIEKAQIISEKENVVKIVNGHTCTHLTYSPS